MNKQDPICNDKAAEAARASFEKYAGELDAHIDSTQRLLHALIQARHSLHMVYRGTAGDLSDQLDTARVAMREAARTPEPQGGEPGKVIDVKAAG